MFIFSSYKTQELKERLIELKSIIKRASFEKEALEKEITTREKGENKMKTKNNITVTITDFDINWQKIKSACMTTISKQAGPKEPPKAWKRKLLLSQHSPLRRGCISWKWDEIPYCISTHFARHHEGCEKFVGTERADRTEIKDRSQRSQMNPVPMEMDANIQALINISEKRLCTCADPTTTKYWQAVLDAVKEYDEDIYWACVPQCVRHGGCPEKFGDCHYFENFAKNLSKEELLDIETRYDKYNEYREKGKSRVRSLSSNSGGSLNENND